MSITDDFTTLTEQTAKLSRDVETELATFPSGAMMLDVRYRGRLFVLAYSPTAGFGVDEVEEEVVGLGTSYRHGFDDFTLAKEKLLSLLATAMSGPAAS